MLTQILVSIFLLFASVQSEPVTTTIAGEADLQILTTALGNLPSEVQAVAASVPVTVTVFAPDDTSGIAPTTPADILMAHIIGAPVDAATAITLSGLGVHTLANTTIRINTNVAADAVFVSGVQVSRSEPDEFSNGTVHIIEEVLPTLSDIVATADTAGGFTTLLAAAVQADLDAVLMSENDMRGFTVFAPTDTAFAADISADLLASLLIDENKDVLAHILLYHVLNGSDYPSFAIPSADDISLETLSEQFISINSTVGVNIDGTADVVIPDIFCSNGIIHAIDSVLLPAFNVYQSLCIYLLNAVRGAIQLSSAVTAVLEGENDVTLFAPTDTALADFAATSAYTNFTNTLDASLSYHAVVGAVASTDLMNDMVVLSADGVNDLRINVYASGATVNCIPISDADLPASNGLIHTIDGVLVPPTETIVDVALEVLPTLATLVVQAELDGVLSGEGNFTVFAPTELAFTELEAANPGITTWLLNHPTDLADVLLYHTLGSTVCAAGVAAGDVETLEGSMAALTVGSAVTYAGATVGDVDILCTNGVIHLIDSVVLPPGFSSRFPATFTTAAADTNSMAMDDSDSNMMSSEMSGEMSNSVMNTETGSMAMTGSESMTDSATMEMTDSMTDAMDTTGGGSPPPPPEESEDSDSASVLTMTAVLLTL